VLYNVDQLEGTPACSNMGLTLTIDDLPSRFNRRWTPPLKAQMLEAIDGGLLSINEAAARYALRVDEIQSWRAKRTSLPLPTAATYAQASDPRLTRLISVLLLRGLINQDDADYIGAAPEQGGRSRLDAFMIDDKPIF
jgi:hypothetical protein